MGCSYSKGQTTVPHASMLGTVPDFGQMDEIQKYQRVARNYEPTGRWAISPTKKSQTYTGDVAQQLGL
jgi:hypothetical protein